MNSIIAKILKCYEQSPEKLDEGQEKALGFVEDCDSRTTSCIKTDTPAGIGQGCEGRDAVGAVFSLLVGRLTDSCTTINFGGESYTGCACHTNLCNTAPTIKQSSASNSFMTIILLTIISRLLL